MTITDVKAVYPNWRNRAQGAWQAHFWQIVVRIETDAGVTGYGYGGGGEPGVLIINGHLRELLIGKTVGSIKDIRTIWDHLYFKSLPYGRKGITLMALSGVDLAMWDLLGRAEGKPVYDLLGGMKKNPVRAYATGQDFARARDLGYTAVKFSHRWQSDADYDTAIEQAGQARKRLDPDALLMMDCYMSWDAEVTLEMHHLLTDYRIYWFEDVLTPDHLAELAALRPQLAPVLLAGGEHDFSHHSFADLARTGALGLWQPDLTWCGGLTAGLRILDLARAHRIPVCPHRGGEIWSLHFIAATDCMDLAETHPARWDTPENLLWMDEPRMHEGVISPLDKPGFGVRLNEEMV